MEKFINLAACKAMEGTMASRHGAVLVNNHKIVSTGCNSIERTKFGKKMCLSCHAEVSAILRASSVKRHRTDQYKVAGAVRG